MQGIPASLSVICPAWTGRLVPAAFATLKTGLQRERDRLGRRPFLTLLFRQDYDYDGLTESLELLDSFTDEAAAARSLGRTAEARLAAALAEPSYGAYRWQRTHWTGQLTRSLPRPPSATVTSVTTTTYKLVNGSGYDSRYLSFEMLRIAADDLVGPDLFTFVNAEQEWVAYFVARGRAAP